MHNWVLLSSFHLFNDASQRCIKSLAGVATCRLAPLLCLFMEDAKTEREKKRKEKHVAMQQFTKESCVWRFYWPRSPDRLWTRLVASTRVPAMLRETEILFYFTRRLAKGNFSLEKGARVAPLGKRETAQSRVVYGGARVLTLRGLFLEALTLTFQKKGESAPHITQNDRWRQIWKGFGVGRLSFFLSTVKLQHYISSLECVSRVWRKCTDIANVKETLLISWTNECKKTPQDFFFFFLTW